MNGFECASSISHFDFEEEKFDNSVKHFIVSDTELLICDFHREQDWHRFIVKNANGIPKQEQKPIKTLLNRVARSRSVQDFLINKQAMLTSQLFIKRPILLNYITSTWLPEETVKVCLVYQDFLINYISEIYWVLNYLPYAYNI